MIPFAAWRLASVLLLLGLASVARADLGVPSKSASKINRNMRLLVQLYDLQENAFVSGTNVNFKLRAKIEGIAPPEPGEPWDAGWVASMTVYIGGQPAGSWTNANPLDTTLTAKILNVRFASTEFSHLAQNDLKLVATFGLARGVIDLVTGQGSLESTTDAAPDLIMPVKVYNSGLLLATQEEYDLNSQTYVIDPNPGYYSMALSSKRAVADARVPLGTSLKHALVPAALQEHLQQEQDLATRLAASTVFFAFTHAEADHFRASKDDGVSPPDDKLFWPEVGTYVARTATIPTHNLVLMYACSSLQLVGNPAPHAFGVYFQNAALPDKAYTGFMVSVWTILNNSSAHAIDAHAHEVWKQLLSYKTVGEAINIANDKYPPVDESGVKAPMFVVGDPFCRLKGVYAETPALLETLRYNWYWTR